YRVTTENGNEFMLVDPARGTRGPAFDHAKVAAALSTAAGTKYDAFKLPFQQIDFSADGKTISFNVERRRWTCDVQGNQCTATADTGGNRTGGQGGGRGGGGVSRPPSRARPPWGERGGFVRVLKLCVSV